jgi:hypothetical protein
MSIIAPDLSNAPPPLLNIWAGSMSSPFSVDLHHGGIRNRLPNSSSSHSPRHAGRKHRGGQKANIDWLILIRSLDGAPRFPRRFAVPALGVKCRNELAPPNGRASLWKVGGNRGIPAACCCRLRTSRGDVNRAGYLPRGAGDDSGSPRLFGTELMQAAYTPPGTPYATHETPQVPLVHHLEQKRNKIETPSFRASSRWNV